MTIAIVCNSRAERGPLESVIAALPEARVVSFDAVGREPHDAMACAIMDFTHILRGYKLVILLGDRYETLAAALAAYFLKIPIVHIHGGETTAGAFDDAFRHSITHMATLHFAPTAAAGIKIAELLGYGPHKQGSCIQFVGAPGLDGIPQNSAQRDHKTVLVTFHPETMAADYGAEACRAMLTAIGDRLLGYEIIFCGVNADPGGEEIRKLIQGYLRNHGGTYMPSASHRDYILMMQHAALVIGNSSAGVIEAPWVGVPSVNLGRRQSGRPMANSIFHSRHGSVTETAAAIETALVFTKEIAPCYSGGAAPKIAAACRAFISRV